MIQGPRETRGRWIWGVKQRWELAAVVRRVGCHVSWNEGDPREGSGGVESAWGPFGGCNRSATAIAHEHAPIRRR